MGKPVFRPFIANGQNLQSIVCNGLVERYIKPVVNKIEQSGLKELLARDPSTFRDMSPFDMARQALRDGLLPARETLLGRWVYQPSLQFLAETARGAAAISGCIGADWYAAATPGYRAEFAEAKTHGNWANSKSREATNNGLAKLAERHDGPVELSEYIFFDWPYITETR